MVEERRKHTSELLRELLESGDSEKALEIAISETERARLVIAESRLVPITERGLIVANSLNGLMEVGKFYAQSKMVPDHLRNAPNECALGHLLAQQWRLNTLMVLQNLYVVYGSYGIKGSLVAGILNRSDAIEGRIYYEWQEQPEVILEKPNTDGSPRHNVLCTACAKIKGTDMVAKQTVDLLMAQGEQWDRSEAIKEGKRAGETNWSKWITMERLMLQYRSTSFLGRVDFSDVMLGVQTTEELEDIHGGKPIEDLQTESVPRINSKPLGFKDIVGDLSGFTPESQAPDTPTEEPAAETTDVPETSAPTEEPVAPAEETPAEQPKKTRKRKGKAKKDAPAKESAEKSSEQPAEESAEPAKEPEPETEAPPESSTESKAPEEQPDDPAPEQPAEPKNPPPESEEEADDDDPGNPDTEGDIPVEALQTLTGHTKVGQVDAWEKHWAKKAPTLAKQMAAKRRKEITKDKWGAWG